MSVTVTPGSGATVSGEVLNSENFQRIKLADGTSGSSVMAVVNPDGSIKASIIGVPTVSFSGSPSISGAVTVVGTPSISGTVNIAGTPSISGTVNIAGNPSISGTVLVNNGSVVGFQGGSWSASVAGGFANLYAPSASFISAVTSVMTGTGLTSVVSAAGGSIKNYITHILVTNGAATGTFVDIKDGGGNVLYSGYAAASGGGFSSTLPVPLVGSANKSVDAQARAQASIIVAMTGYTA